MVVDLFMPANEEVAPGSRGVGATVAGFFFIKWLKKQEECANRDTPIVILTGVRADRYKETAEAARQYNIRFVSKPIDPDELYAILQTLAKE
jgi:CheY-like chemotaxis protein